MNEFFRYLLSRNQHWFIIDGDTILRTSSNRFTLRDGVFTYWTGTPTGIYDKFEIGVLYNVQDELGRL